MLSRNVLEVFPCFVSQSCLSALVLSKKAQESGRIFCIESLHASLLLWLLALWPALSMPVSVCLGMHLIMCLVACLLLSFLVSLYVFLYVLIYWYLVSPRVVAVSLRRKKNSCSPTHVGSIHCLDLRSMPAANALYTNKFGQTRFKRFFSSFKFQHFDTVSKHFDGPKVNSVSSSIDC